MFMEGDDYMVMGHMTDFMWDLCQEVFDQLLIRATAMNNYKSHFCLKI